MRNEGMKLFHGTSDKNSEYLHVVRMVHDHQVKNIGEIYINDINITDEPYSWLVTAKRYLGDRKSIEDQELIKLFGDTIMPMNEVAFIYLKIKFDGEVFESYPLITIDDAMFVCPDCGHAYMKCDHCGKEVPIGDLVDMFHTGICEHCQHTDSAGNIHEHQLDEACPDHLPGDTN